VAAPVATPAARAEAAALDRRPRASGLSRKNADTQRSSSRLAALSRWLRDTLRRHEWHATNRIRSFVLISTPVRAME
jgi:hypothetical protein